MGDMAELYDYDYDPGDDETPGALCRKCGKWFAWWKHDGKFRLTTENGKIHEHTTTASLSEFPLVD
jgi:hypothetical protein